jgi:hypothetical protein
MIHPHYHPHYHRHWRWKLPLPLPLPHQLPLLQSRKILHSQILQLLRLKRRHPLLQLLPLRHCRPPPLQLMTHPMQLLPPLQHHLQLQPTRMMIHYHHHYHHYRHYLRNLNLPRCCHHLYFPKKLMLQQKMKNYYCRHRHYANSVFLINIIFILLDTLRIGL